ncbi:MAG: metallophosphoesterase, partial [Rhodospirillales bacterium]
MIRSRLLAAGTVLALLAAALPLAAQDFTLSILHTNDVHSRIDQVSASGSFCTPQNAAQDRCVGGYARLATAIRELRAVRPNAILLDAGDVFQ